MRYSRFVIMLTLTVFLFICNSEKVSAAEWNKTVPIAKQYKEALFNFEFDVEQDYFIEIVNPDGEITYKNQTESFISVSVKDIIKGTYSISIQAKEDFEVKVYVECQNTSITNVGDGNLTITSSFSGLQTYFRDGALMIKWNDTNLGKVTVEVTNPETMQKIAKTTVDGNSCKIDIPSNVKEIEVFIVPTSSAKVSGAGVNYTLTVVRDVNGSIEVPNVTLTNKDIVEVNLKFNTELTVVVLNNNVEVVRETFEAGNHTISVPLTATINNLVAYMIDEKGNMVSKSFSIEKDLVAPSININEEYNDMEIDTNTIIVTGYVTDASSFYINNNEADILSGGKFSCEIELEEGTNVISLCAMDEAGNETVLVFNVLYKKNRNSKIILFFIGFVASFAALLALVYKKRNVIKSEKNESDEELKVEDIELKKCSEGPKEKGDSKVEKVKKGAPNQKEHLQLKKMRNRQSVPSVIVLLIQIICIIVVFRCFIMPTYIKSGSMEPTLMTHDLVFYNKIAYEINDIKRGDIINFWSEEYGSYFSKRVIGVAGDVIEFYDGYVFINGAKADESAYLGSGIETNCLKKFTVPEGTVFVMGDNRENSIDSRFFKEPYISVDNIVGKYLGQIPNIFK